MLHPDSHVGWTTGAVSSVVTGNISICNNIRISRNTQVARSIVPDRLGAPVYEVKAELFKALAHPVRVRALEMLAEGREYSVGDLAAAVGVEAPHLSQQLGILRRAGLVVSRREATTVFYSLKNPLLVELLAVARTLLITGLEETRELLQGLEAEVAGR